ncbi:accessory gene regulator ArgB-like protein [Anaerotignum sp.]|uniref:accessory gene regulator ArgB-like protein n=1 Tax=Anaerotignum sp. TaxID=2039241 RepID=UPI003FA48DBB
MFKKQIERLTDSLIKNSITKAENKEIIVYDLCIAIDIVFNIITTLVLAFLCGLVLEGLVFLISFTFLRTYAGGYHCEKTINCYFMSGGIIVLVFSAVVLTPSEYIVWVSIGILLISVLTILKFAPVDSTHKPVDITELKYYRTKNYNSFND